MSPAYRPKVHVRTAFISDIHLGTRDCRTDLLLDFLRNVHADELILVGDIVDFWSLRRGLYWPQSHSDVLRSLLGKAKHGTRLIYVPGQSRRAAARCLRQSVRSARGAPRISA